GQSVSAGAVRISRFDPSGNEIWHVDMGSAPNSIIYDGEEGPNGDIVALGSMDSGAPPYDVLWLVSADGQSVQQLNPPGFNILFHTIANSGDGNYVVGGSSPAGIAHFGELDPS